MKMMIAVAATMIALAANAQTTKQDRKNKNDRNKQTGNWNDTMKMRNPGGYNDTTMWHNNTPVDSSMRMNGRK